MPLRSTPAFYGAGDLPGRQPHQQPVRGFGKWARRGGAGAGSSQRYRSVLLDAGNGLGSAGRSCAGALTTSVHRGVSFDGAVIVGQGRSAGGTEAFLLAARYEHDDRGLGDLPGGDFRELSRWDARQNGAVVVGWSASSNGSASLPLDA